MRYRILAFGLLAWACCAGWALAQTRNAQLEGTVEDPSRALVPGAKVTARNIRTQTARSSKTDLRGGFVFPDLQPGVYTLTVEAAGFHREVLSNIELLVAATVTEIVKLQLGQMSESVIVEANALKVQATESQVSNAITLRDIDALPQLNRTPITLAILQPGVQIDVRAGQDASFSHVNGLRQGGNNSALDGVDINDAVTPRLGLSLTASNTDSIEEFRVVTAGGKAEYGRNAGAQIQLITRSGTNRYHGNAFDYLRNTDLNANDFFNNQSGGAVPKYIRNIYGGSFGGPVIHNKTFIFGNFQGTRTRQDTIRTRIVPTDSAKAGIFRWQEATGAVQSYNFLAADPRRIGIDPAVAKIFALYPEPNNSDIGDGLNSRGFRFNNPVPSLEDQFTIKADHHLTDRHALFLRWSWQRNAAVDNLNNADATFPGLPQGLQGGHRWGFAAGSDWSITPTLISEFHAGHQSALLDFPRPNRPTGPAYITNLFTDVYFAGFPSGRNSPVNDFSEALTKVITRHIVKAGASLRFTKQYAYSFTGVYPNVTTMVANGNNVPTSIGPAGLTAIQRSTFEQLYNDVLGRIDQVVQTFYSNLQQFQPGGTPRVRNFVLHDYAFYAQDDWRISRRLTLNLGLRWEFFGVPREQNALQGTVDKAALINGVTQASDITLVRNTNWYRNDTDNFAPRFGFAYDIFGDGKTALRGHYGLFYDRMVGAFFSGIDGNTPGFAQVVPVFPNQNGGDIRFNDNYPLPGQPPSPVLQLPETRSTNLNLANLNLRTGYVHSYSLNIQRQLGDNTILQIGYVGNRGVKLLMDVDVNQPRIYGDFLNSFKEIQAFQTSGLAPPAGNAFVRLFGSATAAISALGATSFSQGLVGTVANALDRNQYTRYAAAGLPSTYLRNYPQFSQVVLGTNNGRSYYDSLQTSVRRTAGALQLLANYTWSKTLDNISTEGNGFTVNSTASAVPIDSYNLKLNKALSDYDRPHSFNAAAFYELPIGKRKRFGGDLPQFADTLLGGWQLGALAIVQSGQPFSVYSQRNTVAVSGVPSEGAYAQFSGTDSHIGQVQERGNGVYYFTPDQVKLFTYPGAGEIGNAGRNMFRNPRFFEIDASMVKRFKVTERQAVTFRAEAYNLFNHPNFGLVSTGSGTNNLNLNNPGTFGKFTQTLGTQVGSSSARTLQLALRYEF